VAEGAALLKTSHHAVLVGYECVVDTHRMHIATAATLTSRSRCTSFGLWFTAPTPWGFGLKPEPRNSAVLRSERARSSSVKGILSFFFTLFISHVIHTHTRAERRARNIAGAEALAVARRPEVASREKKPAAIAV